MLRRMSILNVYRNTTEGSEQTAQTGVSFQFTYDKPSAVVHNHGKTAIIWRVDGLVHSHNNRLSTAD